jgi:hypothetical protein
MDKPKFLDTVTKIIFVGGAILIFAILAYLIITWVPVLINKVSNIGSSVTQNLKKGEQIVVETNKKDFASSENIQVSWNYEPATRGDYYISYKCEDSLLFDIQSVNGNKRILCNSPFKLGQNIKSVLLIPTVTKENIFIDAEIKISYKDADEKEIAFGTTDVTVKNTNETIGTNPYDSTTSTSTNTSTGASKSSVKTEPVKTATTYVPTYSTSGGKADLQITNIGRLENSGFSFIVWNYGSKASGTWYFTYTDAMNPSKVVYSPIQMSLAPGQGMLNTVRFDSQRYDSQTISIVVDATNSVSESNESNNYGSVVIYGNGNNYNNDYNDDDKADLIIEDLEVGRMSGSRFVEDDEIDEDDDAAIRFTVKNKGGESTGSWRFEISNTPNGDDYRSSRQSSLRPGERVEIIVEFENPDRGTYNIRVEVDSDDDVNEERENNNTKSKRLEVTN